MSRASIALVVVLLLLPAVQAKGQNSASSKFLEEAGALQSKLTQWRQTLNSMNLNLLPPALTQAQRNLLERERSSCLALMDTLSREIVDIQSKPTLAREAQLVLDARRFAGTASALHDSLNAFVLVTPRTGDLSAVHRWMLLESKIGSMGSYFNEGQLIHQLDAIGASARPAAVKPQLPGEISGHVYRADTGKPLAGVKVMLGAMSSFETPLFSVRTATDGSYSFSSVSPGAYWLVAYGTGFDREIYRRGLSHQQWAVLSLASGQKVGGIDMRLHPLVSVVQMNGKALVAEFGVERFWLRFGPGPFSPDGKLFAFTVGDPDPYQAWLYNMSSKRLLPITMKPAMGLPPICGMAWVGETLYAEAAREGCPYNLSFFAATAEGARQISALPAAAQAALRKERTRNVDVARDSRFLVTFERPCSGCGFKLTVATTQGRRIYQNADLGPGGFVFERRPSAVIFPRFSYPAISVLDLNTRRVRDFYLPNRAEELLDARPEAGGFLIAYTSYGPCEGYRGKGGLYGIHPQRAPHNVCFANIPFEGKK